MDVFFIHESLTTDLVNKMAAKSVSYTELEKELLLSLVEERINTIESKKSCGTTLENKKKCWQEIVTKFNCNSDVNERNMTQLT